MKQNMSIAVLAKRTMYPNTTLDAVGKIDLMGTNSVHLTCIFLVSERGI